MPLEQSPVRVSVSVAAGYDTNAGTTQDDQGSFFSSASIGLTYSFGTERTRANISTSANLAYYDSPGRSGLDYSLPKLALNLGVTHAASERLNLTGNIVARYGDEPDFSLGVGQNRRSGKFFFTADSISASYQWLERFSTVSSYSFDTIQYEDEVLSAFQDRFGHSLNQQFRFLFLPMTTITADYGISVVNYSLPHRDSLTHSLLAGITQTVGPHVQGSFRAGAEFRHSEQERSNSVNPYFDGTLNCVVGDKTSVNLTARYSTEESDVIGTSSRNTFRTGAGVTYLLTARITGNLNLYYVHDGNNQSDLLILRQPSFSEDSVDVGMSLNYAVNPRLSVNVGYHRTEILSDVSQRSYSRASYSSGLSYSF